LRNRRGAKLYDEKAVDYDEKPPLGRFRNGYDLQLLVDRRRRMGGVLQLLLAQTDRLKAF
jgi:hypothetical protein